MENEDNVAQNVPEITPRERTKKIGHLGTIRLLADLEKIEVAFLVLAVVSIVGAFIITLIRVAGSAIGHPDFTFGVLLLINLVFVLCYTVNGIFTEQPFELLMSVAATLVVLLYCIIEYATNGHNDIGSTKALKLGRLIGVCIFGPADMVLGIIIAWRFFVTKRLIFRTVGGNVGLQNMCLIMFSFTAFLKFDFQLVISLLVLVLNGGASNLSVNQKLVLGIGVPLSFCCLILGYILIRFETWKLSIIFWLSGLLFPIYVIYLLIKLEKVENSPMLFPTTIAAGCIGILIRIITMVLSCLVTRNFKKGLKERVFPTVGDA